jgi:polyphenol oxidase
VDELNQSLFELTVTVSAWPLGAAITDLCAIIRLSVLDPIQSSMLAESRRVTHGFFTRAGGVSKGVYAALNCGLGSADSRRDVAENRARVAAHFGASGDKLLTCHQIHSATAIIIDRAWVPDAQPRADALVTRTPGLVLGALAADCAPILFADHRAGVIAAAHAGWKGALGGIIEATVLAMEQVGATRQDIKAAIGPCIGQRAYEVGPEFQAAFLADDRGHATYFTPPSPNGHALFDLPGFVFQKLRGAKLGGVESVTQCTYTHSNQFFSYRRMTHAREIDYGRQISALVLS